MKIKVILILITIALAIWGFFFIENVKNNLAFFKKIENSKKNVPYNLKSNKLNLLDVRTEKYETLKLDAITVVNFWASWCKPCIKEYPSFEQLSKKYPNVNFILVSFDSLQAQKAVIEQNSWTLPAYFCKDTNTLAKPYILPTSLIIKDSTVHKEVYGYVNWIDEKIIYKVDSLFKKLNSTKTSFK